MKKNFTTFILLISLNSQAFELSGNDAQELYNFIAEYGKTPSGVLNQSCMPGLCSTSLSKIYCVHSQGMEKGSENYHCLFELFLKGSFKATTSDDAHALFEKISNFKDLNSAENNIMKLTAIRCQTISVNNRRNYICNIEN